MRGVLVTWRADGAERRGILTVEHAASSYGLPVVVEAGRTRRALGAAEVGELSLAAPVTAATRDVQVTRCTRLIARKSLRVDVCEKCLPMKAGLDVLAVLADRMRGVQ